MPQMCPMNWFMLMVYFLFIYFLLMVLIYYFINLNVMFKLKKINNLVYIMKWY